MKRQSELFSREILPYKENDYRDVVKILDTYEKWIKDVYTPEEPSEKKLPPNHEESLQRGKESTMVIIKTGSRSPYFSSQTKICESKGVI